MNQWRDPKTNKPWDGQTVLTGNEPSAMQRAKDVTPPAYSASPEQPKKPKKPTIYTERGAVTPLLRGETILIKGIGNSMTPILMSGQVVKCAPIKPDEVLKENDIVLVKVKSQVYMHKITAIKGNQYQISNNHGHVNGWVKRDKIYGRYIKD